MRPSLIICLVLLAFFSVVNAQQVIFYDDFESGDANYWEYEPSAWQVIQEDGNHVFEGKGHYWAEPMLSKSSEITMETKFMLVI